MQDNYDIEINPRHVIVSISEKDGLHKVTLTHKPTGATSHAEAQSYIEAKDKAFLELIKEVADRSLQSLRGKTA
jgi:hypothetical protein